MVQPKPGEDTEEEHTGAEVVEEPEGEKGEGRRGVGDGGEGAVSFLSFIWSLVSFILSYGHSWSVCEWERTVYNIAMIQ